MASEAKVSASKAQRKEIEKGIFVYTSRQENPTSYVFRVECAKMAKLRFTIDFTGSTNFALEDGSQKKTTDIKPFETKIVAHVSIQNPRAGGSMRLQYSWQENIPDDSTLQEIIARDAKTIGRMVESATKLDFGAESATIKELQDKCASWDVNFVDVEFPPTVESMGTLDVSKLKASSKATAKDEDKYKLTTWRRPCAFMDGSYDIFQGAIEPADIHQGAIANCWLMCALAGLAERPEEVRRLFISDDGSGDVQKVNSAGVYKVRLCKNAQWQFVCLDDYFPCSPGSGPICSKAHGNELWVLLVEKAMAKVCGSYCALHGGSPAEALLDLTGAPSYHIRLEDKSVRADVASGKFWNDMLSWDQQGFFLSASTAGQDTWTTQGKTPMGGPGLVSGHAYTILQVVQTSTGHRLMQMRNPWASFEWHGDWSDRSPLWTPALRKELHQPKPTDASANDGLFWMSVEDFLQHFCAINVCKLRSGKERWHEVRVKGHFSVDKGSPTTTMYKLSITKKTHVELGIHQADERNENAKKYIDIGIAVLKSAGGGHYELASAAGTQVDRQVQLSMDLDEGHYFVVPVTTGCRLSQQGSAAPASPVAIHTVSKDGQTVKFTEACENALREIFRRLDEDMDGLLSRDELNSFTLMTEGCDMTDGTYKWLIESFASRDGGMTADGFVECYYCLFEAADRDEGVVWHDLHYNGYDNSLNLPGARTFVVAVHSDSKVDLRQVAFDADLYEEACELPVKQLGTPRHIVPDQLVMHSLQNGYWGVSLAFENLTDRTCRVSMDCSASTNLMSHTGDLLATVHVPAHETKIVHNLLPIESAAWQWQYKVAWHWYTG